MVFVLLLLGGLIGGIGGLWWLAPRELTAREKICVGGVVGMALPAWISYLSLLVTGLDRLSQSRLSQNRLSQSLMWSVLIGLAALVCWRWWRNRRAEHGEKIAWEGISWRGLVWDAGWGLLLVWIFIKVIDDGAGGIFTAPANNFGDLGFHLSAVSSFAYGENVPPENPIFAGLPFTYPFLIDYLTALLIDHGASLRLAFFITGWIPAICLVGIIESLGMRLTGSRLAGRLAPVIFLFGGGLGFLKFFEDLGGFLDAPAEAKKGIFWFLAHLPASYSINNSLVTSLGEVPLRYGNPVTTMLVPQRSMLFGLPLVSAIMLFWHVAVKANNAGTRRRAMLLAGVLAGMLPMLHAHGFFAVGLACGGMILGYRLREWVWFLLPVGLLAGPQALWLSRTQVRNTLFRPHLWWEAGESNPLLFWLVNDGVFILLLLAVMAWAMRQRKDLARFQLPFVIWFIVPNVMLLAPWPWDNIKVLVCWAMASSVMVALGVALVLGDRQVVVRAAGVLLLAVLTLTGLLDVWRGLSPAERVPLFSADDVRVAARIREATPPRATILHAPIHNSPVALTGRRSLMGYAGHLWSHGIEWQKRDADIRKIFALGPEAEQLLTQYGVDYVLIGLSEVAECAANDEAFAAKYPVVFSEGGMRLFRIR